MANSSDKKNILIIGEFPVFHKGYVGFFEWVLELFKKGSGKSISGVPIFYVGFLDNKIIKEMTKLESDIRAIPLQETKKIIKAFLPIKNFFVIDKKNYSRIIDRIGFDEIIVLDGDKSGDFANLFLSDTKYNKRIRHYDISLKWEDAKVVQFKKKKTSLNKKDLAKYQGFLKEAEDQAKNSKCWWRHVGAVLVKDDKIILGAFNKMMPFDDECYKTGCVRDGIPAGRSPEICSVAHAEATIIATAANKGISLKETTLYTTHFPCSACAKLVVLAGIKKIVYSKGSAFFDGERVLKKQGIEIIKI